MSRATVSFLAFAASTLVVAPAAESQPALQATSQTYADLADLALQAPVAAHVRLRRAVPLKPGEGGSVGAGRTRFFVEADLISLIRGSEGLPARVTYLADFRNGSDGKAVRPAKKSEYIVLASSVPNRPGELRLVSPDANLAYAPERAAQLRSILREAAAPGAAPAISGIGKAFHVPGSLPGESETQIFLQTTDGRPVSLSVLRRPGETPRWAFALGEIVDDAAEPPKPNSLLWYRLACTLPRSLPPQSLADVEEAHKSAVQFDYQMVMSQLGTCLRSRR